MPIVGVFWWGGETTCILGEAPRIEFHLSAKRKASRRNKIIVGSPGIPVNRQKALSASADPADICGGENHLDRIEQNLVGKKKAAMALGKRLHQTKHLHWFLFLD